MKKNATLTKNNKIVKIVIIIWMILGALFILKIGNSLMGLSTLKDAYRKSFEGYSENVRYQRQTKEAYNSYLEGLKNNDDVIIRTYFSQKYLTRILIFMIIELPYISLAVDFFKYIDDNYEFQKEIQVVRGSYD